MSKNFWDERYAAKEYAYGKEPNGFFRSFIDSHSPRSLLLPADGEGRNAVYAASHGWDVTAFDQSTEARRKALLLAEEKKVHIKYLIADVSTVTFDHTFDTIAFIFLHFPIPVRNTIYQHLLSFLNPGGNAVLEAFNQQHIEYRVKYGSGGPSEPERLFTVDSVKEIFTGYSVVLLEERVVELQEGQFHKGLGSVISCIAEKLQE